MAIAVGCASMSSIGSGRAILQFGLSTVVPGMLVRSSTPRASSRVAVAIIDGASASARYVAIATSATGAVGSKPVTAANRAAIGLGASVPDQTPAIVGRSWVVTAARAWDGYVDGGESSNQTRR